MRVLVLATLLLLAPTARAALELDGPRILEADAATTATFEVPFRSSQDGEFYAKLLPTPGNAVNDGSGPNASGWRVAFSLGRADGGVEALGERVDGSPTTFAPVAAGEALRLVVEVKAPAGVVDPQRVFVALAYRAPGAAATASGASQDEARAVTLLLRAPTAAAAVIVPPTPDVGLIPTDGSSGDGASPPAPQVILVREATPWWLLVVALSVLALAVVALAMALVVLARVTRAVQAQKTPVRVAVQGEPERVGVKEPPAR